MGRKVLQGFANNLCQIFLGYQCYEDLPSIEQLGLGRYEIDILTTICKKDGIEIDSFVMAGKLQQWFSAQLGKEDILIEEIKRAVLIVNVTDIQKIPYWLRLRKYGFWPREYKLTNFYFECFSYINAYSREYSAQDSGRRELA